MVSSLDIQSSAADIFVRKLASRWYTGAPWLRDSSYALYREPNFDELIYRDPNFAQALNYRCHLVAGKDWMVAPPNNATDAETEAAAIVQGLIEDHLAGFDTTRFQMARAFLTGASYAGIEGEYREVHGLKGRWWVPLRLRTFDKMQFRKVPKRNGDGVTATWEFGKTKGDGIVEWVEFNPLHVVRVLYDDDQRFLGYGRGLRESLYYWWYALNHLFKEVIQAAERAGQGTFVAKINGLKTGKKGTPNTALVTSMKTAIERQRQSHILIMDKEDEAQLMDMASGGGVQFMLELRDRLKDEINQAILGSTRVTGGGESGSYARAAVEQDSTEALIQFDRRVNGEAYTARLVGGVYDWNRHNLEAMGLGSVRRGRFQIRQDPVIDPLKEAQIQQTALAAGIALRKDEVYERIGYSQPSEDDEVVKPREAMPSPFGGEGPLSGLGGFGPDA